MTHITPMHETFYPQNLQIEVPIQTHTNCKSLPQHYSSVKREYTSTSFVTTFISISAKVVPLLNTNVIIFQPSNKDRISKGDNELFCEMHKRFAYLSGFLHPPVTDGPAKEVGPRCVTFKGMFNEWIINDSIWFLQIHDQMLFFQNSANTYPVTAN